MCDIKLQSGKLNLLLDGQFGSTGKGLFSQYIGTHNHIDIAISNASSNAGHTFYYTNMTKTPDNKIVVKHLPVSGVINKRCTIYLCAGSIINPKILLEEIENTGVGDRVYIHPRAAIITDDDISNEHKIDGVKLIASTMSGVGSALTRKINRTSLLAKDIPELQKYISEIDIQYLLDEGCTAFMEVPQGMDLSLNHGYSYPYCTSRDITPASALNDACIHPRYIGNISVTLRTFPIRVGNIIENGEEVGYSGPFYDDSVEIGWDKIGVPQEYTTRTNRVRRVATFSNKQYDKMLRVMKPDNIFLNFCNYLKPDKVDDMIRSMPGITHIGFGPKISDIRIINRD